VALCACTALVLAGLGTNAASQAGTTVPNPFKIVASWSAKKLGLHHPTETLAIGPSGNLYVTDYSQRVTEISPKGRVVRRWGKRGSGPGQFDFAPNDPTSPKDVHGSVAVGPDGKVYVADYGNARVEVFSAKGRFIRQFGSFGNGPGHFYSPYRLTVDQSSNIYVGDDQLMRLQKFSPKGGVLWSIGGSSSGNPDFVGHLWVNTVDRHGRLVVLNSEAGRVLYLDQSGHEVDSFGSPADFGSNYACDATVDARGFTYVDGCCATSNSTCSGPDVTYVFDASHTLVGRWVRSPLFIAPRFGPRGEIFALTWRGALVKLRITHPSG
jgi:hypothetical protein